MKTKTKAPKYRIYRGDEYRLVSKPLGHREAKHDAEMFRSRGHKAHIKTFGNKKWYVYVK